MISVYKLRLAVECHICNLEVASSKPTLREDPVARSRYHDDLIIRDYGFEAVSNQLKRQLREKLNQIISSRLLLEPGAPAQGPADAWSASAL